MLLAMSPKVAAMAGAVVAYVAAGSVAFHVLSSITGDVELANRIVALLSLPLAAPLYFAVGWIEKRL